MGKSYINIVGDILIGFYQLSKVDLSICILRVAKILSIRVGWVKAGHLRPVPNIFVMTSLGCLFIT